MKRIFLLVSLLVGISSNAQMITVTEAPATDILLGEQIADGLKSLQVSMDNYELVKSNVEKIEKVNSYIGQLQLISDMIDRQQEAIKNAQQVEKLIKNIKNATTAKSTLNSVSNSLTAINNSAKMINKITSSGFFNMSDKERIDMLEKENQIISSNARKIKSKLYILKNL